jgi:1,4-dihydroxy-2-naphthoyl-CoA hydrolase
VDLSEMLSAMPFSLATGIELTTASKERVEGQLAWSAERCTAAGIMHGGAIMTLADSLGAICAFLNLEPGQNTSTIESKTNFFRAVRSGTVHAVSELLHRGRATIVVQTDVRDDERRRVAFVTQTQAVLTPTG